MRNHNSPFIVDFEGKITEFSNVLSLVSIRNFTLYKHCLVPMANPLVTLRSATQSDIPAIKAIHSYYILNTLITLAIVPSTDGELLSKYKSITSQGLPYIVAVDASANSAIGYAYVTGFRSFKGGFKHTVELSLFCHPEWRGQGVGTLLLKKILEVLKEPGTHPEYIVNPRSDDLRVRIVVACISVDEAGRDNALDLKQYYQKFGFELVGHLKKVGHKFDQWIDTNYLQLALW